MVHPSATIGKGCVLGPAVVIGPNCRVAEGVRLAPCRCAAPSLLRVLARPRIAPPCAVPYPPHLPHISPYLPVLASRRSTPCAAHAIAKSHPLPTVPDPSLTPTVPESTCTRRRWEGHDVLIGSEEALVQACEIDGKPQTSIQREIERRTGARTGHMRGMGGRETGLDVTPEQHPSPTSLWRRIHMQATRRRSYDVVLSLSLEVPLLQLAER